MSFIQRAWYCAGWSRDIQAEPVGLKMLDQNIVMYRDTAGKVVALEGRCPHRFAPLARGKVSGDELMCPYHGLRFNRAGQCVLNPHGDGFIPPKVKLRAYPTLEKAGAVWIWFGEPELADPGQVASETWMGDDRYAVFTGSLRVNANYQMVADNLLDLTHAPYLHEGSISNGEEKDAETTHEFRVDGDNSVHSNYVTKGIQNPFPNMVETWGYKPFDFHAYMKWRPASSLYLSTYVTDPGAPVESGQHQPSFHFLTPESDTATHYFYAIARNYRLDDEALTAKIAEFVRRAFAVEDGPMIEACQDIMGTSDLMSLHPAILKTDIAAIQARRVIAKILRAENGETKAPAEAEMA